MKQTTPEHASESTAPLREKCSIFNSLIFFLSPASTAQLVSSRSHGEALGDDDQQKVIYFNLEILFFPHLRHPIVITVSRVVQSVGYRIIKASLFLGMITVDLLLQPRLCDSQVHNQVAANAEKRAMRIYDCDERSGGFDLHIPAIDETFFHPDPTWSLPDRSGERRKPKPFRKLNPTMSLFEVIGPLTTHLANPARRQHSR